MDLDTMTTVELEALLAEAEADLDRWGTCDNQSDLGCCLRCGFWAIRDELNERRWAASEKRPSNPDVRLLRNPVLTVERARALGIL